LAILVNAVMVAPSKVIRVDAHNEKQLSQLSHELDTSNNTRKRNHSLVSDNSCPCDMVEDHNKNLKTDATITDKVQVGHLLQSISNQINIMYVWRRT